jgi:hypothetical protein
LLPGTGFIARLFHVALPGTAGLVVFVAAVFALDIREVRNLWLLATRRKS